MDRSASLTFLARNPRWEVEKPYEIWLDTDEPLQRTNCVFEEHHGILVRDVRRIGDAFTLDSGGFEFVEHKSTYLPLSGEQLEASGRQGILPYLAETVALVKNHTGAEKAFCFDWRVRKIW
jgi:hypothetical protein